MKTLIAVILCGFAAPVSAQIFKPGEISGFGFYDFGSKKSYSVATTKIGTARNVLKKGFDLDAKLFIGVANDARAGVGGGALSYDWHIAENASFTIGLGGWMSAGNKPRGGLIFGFSLRR